MVDQLLKRGRSVGEPEGHHAVLKMPVSRTERSELFMTLLDPNEVIGRSNIQFREYLGPHQPVQGFADKG